MAVSIYITGKIFSALVIYLKTAVWVCNGALLLPPSFAFSCFVSCHISMPLLLCPSSIIDCLCSICPHPPFLLQPSNSVEGPEWSCGATTSCVSSPVTWRGRVPDGTQIQKRPGAEAEDPAPRACSAPTTGWPLPHWGQPWGDLWGKKNQNSMLYWRMTFSYT